MLEGPEPEVRIGRRCDNPYRCSFAGHCHAGLPPHPVTELPYISSAVLDALVADGILAVEDVPTGYPGLSAAQRSVCALARSGEPGFAGDVARSLEPIVAPVHFLDFETIMPALPLYPGTRPWQQVPFQWSDHVLREDGGLEHREFLFEGRGDPRPALVSSLLDALGAAVCVVYTKFENTVIGALAEALPEQADRLREVQSRLFDLERAVRAHVRHPACLGRTSIKVVLPALVSDLSYEGLAIADGGVASLRYLRIVSGDASPEERERTLCELREYCGTDTLAMVRLLDVLKDAAPAS